MIQTIKSRSAKFFLVMFSLLSGINAIAQDSSSTKIESNSVVSHAQSGVSTDTAMWYTNPFVWVAGAAVLLLIIILAVRSSSSRTSSTTTTGNGGISRSTTTTVRED